MTLRDLFRKLSNVIPIISFGMENEEILTIDYIPASKSCNHGSQMPREVGYNLRNGDVKSLDGHGLNCLPERADELVQRYIVLNKYGKDDRKMTFDELCCRISKIRSVGSIEVDPCEIGVFIIQLSSGTSINLDKDGHIDLCGLDKCNVPDKIFDLVREYKENKGDSHMNKKEINERISKDIQQLAKDLTKKKEIDQSTKITKKIANELGVKLPKTSKK